MLEAVALNNSYRPQTQVNAEEFHHVFRPLKVAFGCSHRESLGIAFAVLRVLRQYKNKSSDYAALIVGPCIHLI
nr:hypothetical protein [Vibrio parahaemolyticus]